MSCVNTKVVLTAPHSQSFALCVPYAHYEIEDYNTCSSSVFHDFFSRGISTKLLPFGSHRSMLCVHILQGF